MKNKVLKSTLIQKEKNNEILITSIIVAFGINILTTGILGFFKLEDKYILLIIIGLIFSLIIIICYSILKIKQQNAKIEINGLIIYDAKNNKIIDIPEYDISNDMVKYLSAAFSESKVLADNWNNGKIGLNIDFIGENKKQDLNNNIIIELIEYSFLSTLSTLLEDYYNINNIRNEDIKSISFDELPVLLRNNSFLKLFSEDMDNREVFLDFSRPPSNTGEEIVYAIGKNGVIFDKFDLKLPKEIKIKKDNATKIEFFMKYFSLKIEYVFDGLNTIVDNDFYEYYLNIEHNSGLFSDLEFGIIINVKFNNKILFSQKKIQNYMWVDNLLNKLIENFDIDTFYTKINWENNKCVIKSLNNMINKNYNRYHKK